MPHDVVIIPGLARVPADLSAFADLGRIVPLPGQGAPVLPEMTFADIVASLRGGIPADALVVGESLGGLLALGLPNPVLAIDPPLTTSKQWALQIAARDMARRIAKRPFDDLLAHIFGYMPDGGLQERIYYGLLERPQATHILTGDLPLFPGHLPVPQPCMIDDVDRYMLKQAGVPLHQISGPHALMDANPAGVRQVILEVRDALESQGAG